MIRRYSKGILIFLLFSGLSSSMRAGEPTPKSSRFDFRKILFGIASYYHKSLQGLRTFNGQHYSSVRLTAAHKFLPMGTLVKVTDLASHKTVIVTINDRLPQSSKRSIDLSVLAAKKLCMIAKGLARVKIEILKDYDALTGVSCATN